MDSEYVREALNSRDHVLDSEPVNETLNVRVFEPSCVRLPVVVGEKDSSGERDNVSSRLTVVVKLREAERDVPFVVVALRAAVGDFV